MAGKISDLTDNNSLSTWSCGEGTYILSSTHSELTEVSVEVSDVGPRTRLAHRQSREIHLE